MAFLFVMNTTVWSSGTRPGHAQTSSNIFARCTQFGQRALVSLDIQCAATVPRHLPCPLPPPAVFQTFSWPALQPDGGATRLVCQNGFFVLRCSPSAGVCRPCRFALHDTFKQQILRRVIATSQRRKRRSTDGLSSGATAPPLQGAPLPCPCLRLVSASASESRCIFVFLHFLLLSFSLHPAHSLPCAPPSLRHEVSAPNVVK